jgi:tetratricopeptide (TPR) repeat protein
MRRAFIVMLLLAGVAGAQVTRIAIPVGTPEDKAIQAITDETDSQKKMVLLQAFVKDFAANPQAVAYGNWQLEQQYYEQGDNAKALEHGQQAVALQPNDLELLMTLATVAQRANANDVLVDCAVRGGTAFNGIAGTIPKPEGKDPELIALEIQQAQEPYRQTYQFLEVSGLNAMVAEQNSKKRMGYIERYLAAFPESRFQEQVMQLAIFTLGQLNDASRLASFGEKALAANPKSVATLVMLSEAFGESSAPGYAARGEGYARKALDLVKTQSAAAATGKPAAEPTLDADKARLYSGLAHSALGYALMKEGKDAASIAELKTATAELKGNADNYSTALYRLGFVYAKTGKLAEAKAALGEVAGMKGPFQQPARDLLAKVEAAIKAGPTKKGR